MTVRRGQLSPVPRSYTRRRTALALVPLVVATWLWSVGGERDRAAADPSTPIAATSIQAPTALPSTPISESTQGAEPTAPVDNSLPTVPTPVYATPVYATSVSTQPGNAPSPTSVPAVSAPTPTTRSPLPAGDSTSLSNGVLAPLPSPAQLRLSARLRWGHRIPAAVRRWAFLIVPAAHKYGLSPNLIAAVMTMESGGDPLALSPADARGLMQVLHGPWDPAQNVDVGAHMLATFLSQFHSVRLALAAYNAGPGAVQSYNGVPPYRETRDYVIVVSYLFSLYNHHVLNAHSKAHYRSALRDLAHFSDQQKRVAKVARITHEQGVVPSVCDMHASACTSRPEYHATVTQNDPFWLMPGAPDPLQRVDPLLGP